MAAAGGGNAPFAASLPTTPTIGFTGGICLPGTAQVPTIPCGLALGGTLSAIPAFALGASDPGAFGSTVDATALPSPRGALALPSDGSFGNATGVSALEGAASESAAGLSGSTVDTTALPSGTLAGVATCGTSG